MRTTAPITILLLNYRQVMYISKALESLAMQTILPGQILLIDDGSPGEELQELTEIVNRFPDLFIQTIFDSKNVGHSARMNQALSLATEEFFLLLSADDWLESDAIENLIRQVTCSDDVIWGNIRVVNADGTERGYVRPRENWQGTTARKYLSGGNVFQDLLRVNSFVTGGMSMLRVSTVKNAGGWDPAVTTEDLDLWLRIGKSAMFRYVDEVIGNYRQVPGSKSRNDSQKLTDQSKVFAKHVGVSKDIDRGVAYLASMRWALAVLRQKRRPNVSLKEMAEIIGLPTYRLYLQLPQAIFNPLWGSAQAFIKRKGNF